VARCATARGPECDTLDAAREILRRGRPKLVLNELIPIGSPQAIAARRREVDAQAMASTLDTHEVLTRAAAEAEQRALDASRRPEAVLRDFRTSSDEVRAFCAGE